MRYLLSLLFLICFCSSAWATDIDLPAVSIAGFNRSDIGSDTAMTGVSVTNASTSVTCSSCVPSNAVGMGGFKVILNGVTYDVAAIASRSAFTLSTSYAGSTATVTGTWPKFVVFRIYVTQAFIPNGSTVTIPGGALGSQNWFRRYGASVINDGTQNVLYVPAIDNLPATVDSSNANAKYIGRFYLQGNSGADTTTGYPACVNEWKLPETPTTTSWNQVCLYNLPPNPPPPDPPSYYTSNQIDAGFARTCNANQGIYYSATGNIQSCLSFGTGLTLSSATLSVDADLGSISGLTGTGGLYRIGTDTWALRTLQQPAAGLTITNADGVLGNPTFALANDLAGLEALSGTGLSARTGTSTWATRTLQQPAGGGFTITNADGISGDPIFALTGDLAGVEAVSTTGVAVRSATSTWTTRSLVQPAAGITITNADGVAGNITFALANDLAALEGLSGTGFAARTGTDAYALRTFNGTVNQITITNASGAGGDPVWSLPQDIATSSSVQFGNLALGAGGAIRTTTSAADTLLFQARDVDGAAYTTFLTLKANNSPSLELNQRLEGTAASGSNQNGVSLTIAGGAGTGNGSPGLAILAYPKFTSSGSAVHTFTTGSYPISANMYHGVTDIPISNTTETSIFASGVDSTTTTIEAGMARVGRSFQVRGVGRWSAGAGTLGNITWRPKIGGTTFTTCEGTLTTTSAASDGGNWTLDATFHILTAGTSGTINLENFTFTYQNGTAVKATMANCQVTGVDFSATQTIDITAQLSSVAGGANINVYDTMVDIIR